MTDEFFKKNNIDFNKLNIDPLVANKIRQYMEMANVCHEMAIKNLKNNDIFIPDFYNRILNYCENEKINMPREDAKNSFSSFLLAFAIELNLKSIYILSEYNDLLYKYTSENIQKPFHEYCISETRFEQSGLDEIKQNLGATTKSFGKYPIPNTAKELPGKNNGHYLYALLHNISSQSIRDLIKYETIVSPLKTYFLDDALPNVNQYIQAPEVISLLREFNYEETVQTINNDMLDSSELFENARYQDKITNNDNIRFLISFHLATYIVLCDLLRKKTYQEENFDEYIQNLEDNNSSIYLHKYIFNYNKNEDIESFNIIKNIKQKNPFNYYVLVSKFNILEIEGIIKNYKESSTQISVDFEDFLNYYIFFKQYMEDVTIKYDENKISNISKLFKIIRETNNISELGNHFMNWFKSIDIEELTEDEFEILDKIDPKYIYNSLNYMDKIIYEKCKEKNIKFDFKYSSMKNFNLIFSINRMFCGKKIELSFKRKPPREISRNFELYLFSNFSEKELDEVKKVSIETGSNFENVLYYYQELNEYDFKLCVKIAKETRSNFEDIVVCYKYLTEEELEKCIKIAKQNNEDFSCLSSYCEELMEYELQENIKKVVETQKNFKSLTIYYKCLTEEEIKKCVRIVRTTGFDFNDIINWIKRLAEEEIIECAKLAKKFGYDFSIVAAFYQRNFSENQIIDFFETQKNKSQLILEQLAVKAEDEILLEDKDDELTQEEIQECINIAQKYGVSLNKVCVYYEYLINQYTVRCTKIAYEMKTDVKNILECYKDLILEELEMCVNIAKQTNISLFDTEDIREMQKEQQLEMLNLLKRVKFNSKMNPLKLSELIHNIKLIDGVSDCIFYKTPREIEQIKQICIENEVQFNSKMLYFEMEDLKQYIVSLSILLENLNSDITIDDTQRLLGTAKQFAKYIPPKTEYEEKEEIKSK